MGKQDLQTFINSKKQMSKEKTQTDWNLVKTEWLNKLYELYKNIELWITGFDNDGIVSFQYGNTELIEEHIGIYDAKKMTITIADNQVLLEPVGTILIGAKGRVDMKGKNGTAKIVLVPEKSEGPKISASVSVDNEEKENKNSIPKEWTWKLATSLPMVKYVDLDCDSFSDALLEVTGD
jgi:hypothetical protein